MTQPALTCPKCNMEMALGYQIEVSWVRGPAKISDIVKAFSWELFKAPWEREYIPIGTYRCESCGFLESYARKEFEEE